MKPHPIPQQTETPGRGQSKEEAAKVEPRAKEPDCTVFMSRETLNRFIYFLYLFG